MPLEPKRRGWDGDGDDNGGRDEFDTIELKLSQFVSPDSNIHVYTNVQFFVFPKEKGREFG